MAYRVWVASPRSKAGIAPLTCERKQNRGVHRVKKSWQAKIGSGRPLIQSAEVASFLPLFVSGMALMAGYFRIYYYLAFSFFAWNFAGAPTILCPFSSAPTLRHCLHISLPCWAAQLGQQPIALSCNCLWQLYILGVFCLFTRADIRFFFEANLLKFACT